MLMQKKVSLGGAYARKTDYDYEGNHFEADLKNGDRVVILNEGAIAVGQYGEQQVFKIETRNGEKNLTLNQTTINILVDEFGEDSNKWIGKEVIVFLVKKVIAGKKSIIVYLATKDYSLDEYGELEKGDTQITDDGLDSIDIDQV
jgi:hypothetical protein